MPIRIYVDQGHSPVSNSGARANGLIEENVTFEIGMILAELLSYNPKFEVMTSRKTIDEIIGTDANSSLAYRVNQANDWPADLFVSLHCNYNENPLLNGSEVYVYRIPSDAEEVAHLILDALAEVVNMEDNLVRENPYFYVLRNTTMPANLVEMGYLTNAMDAEKLRMLPYCFALALYLGIVRYYQYQ